MKYLFNLSCSVSLPTILSICSIVKSPNLIYYFILLYFSILYDMGKCYFCCNEEREGYFHYYCNDCALLRRILLVYSPKKCIEILKRTCLRNDDQIDFKVKQELKKDLDGYEPPITRNKHSKNT